MSRLDGKIALVTGGGRGIGRGIVLEFAREGADVAVNYRRDRESAEATAREVESLGRRAMVVQADVSDHEAVVRMIAETRSSFGRLDGGCNSGVAAGWRRRDSIRDGGAACRRIDGVLRRAGAGAEPGVLLFISSIGADVAAAGGAPYHVAWRA
jgi:NAD(P)-dependent dehydrogenase (short-subunit alcohol dehydrogenase family)